MSNPLKRKADKQLTLADLDEEEDNNNGDNELGGIKNQTPEQIAQRKIVKVKRRNAQDSQKGNGKLQLAGNLVSSPQKNEGEGNEKAQEKETVGQDNETDKSNKPEKKEGEAPPSLFGSLGSIKPQSSLFGSGAPTAGLFNSNFKFEPTNSIFGAGSLFSSAPSSNLFQNQPPSIGLFSGFPQTASLFDSANTNFKSMTSAAKQNDSGSDDENVGKGSGSPRAYDPDGGNDQNPIFKASTNQQEKNPYVKIYNKYVEKFKIVTPETDKKTMGNGYFSIEKGEFGEKNIYLCVFRNSIGKTLFQASLSSQYSKYRRLIEKAYKQQLKIAVVTKPPGGQKMKVNYCVISFGRGDEMTQFEQQFQECIDDLAGKGTTNGDNKDGIIKKSVGEEQKAQAQVD